MTASDEIASAEILTTLGKFVTSFSYLLLALEKSTITLLSPGPVGSIVPETVIKQRTLLRAALSDRTASPMVSTFFSVIYEKWKDNLCDGDREILKHLRRELDDVIKERNRLMHDAWFWVVKSSNQNDGVLIRERLRANGRGVEIEEQEYSLERMNDLVENVRRLAGVVLMMVWDYRSGRNHEICERLNNRR
ncbi:MAG: hypothetical protein K6T33_03835 [Thermomonas hydrothermalis]|uniref:hypothetical protein n=1 Tax=Thermomonas hydrothermalis TaxID=213588 RepID=UPI002355E011|nr:hypothetical protein [Thermomonas hydrothermalis]MCL6618901.1 hypothetical protein [Thermomonas hydrothermalis]